MPYSCQGWIWRWHLIFMINLKPNFVNFVFCELLYVFCTWAKTLSCVTDREKKWRRRQVRKLRRTSEFSFPHDPQRAAEVWVAKETWSRPSATPRHLQRRKKDKGKRRRQWKSDETPARPNPTKSTSKPPFYATKVILEPFAHIRGRFRRVLHIVHCRQERQNVEFSNPSRFGSVRPLRTKLIPKMKLGGERDSGTKEKKEEKDVETTLTRRERGRRKEPQVTGWTRRSPTRGPDHATRTESNHRKSAQHPDDSRGPVASAQTRKPSYDLTHQPRPESKNPTDPRPASPVQRPTRTAQPTYTSFNQVSP